MASYDHENNRRTLLIKIYVLGTQFTCSYSYYFGIFFFFFGKLAYGLVCCRMILFVASV